MTKALLQEYKSMLQNKILLLAIFIIPMAFNLLLGIEFAGDQVKHIPMAVVDEDNSSVSRMIVQQFQENETFDVKYRANNDTDLEKLFMESSIRVGMIIPKGFSSGITKAEAPSILMLYDGSHMSIASTAKAKASEILQTLKAGIEMKVLKGKLNVTQDTAEKMALAVRFNNRMLYNPAKSFKNFLNPGLGVGIVQTGVVLMAAVAVRRKELEGEDGVKVRYLLKKILFFTICGTFSLMASIVIQSLCFHVPFRGNYASAMLLSMLFALSISSFAIAVSTWIQDQLLASLVNAILFIPSSVIVGYTWPLLSMPAPYKAAAKWMPFYHYADNVRDLYLKGAPLSSMAGDLIWFGKFTVIALLASMVRALAVRFWEEEKSVCYEKEGEVNGLYESDEEGDTVHC